MSHTVSVKTQVKDAALVEAAAREVGATYLGVGSHKLFQGSKQGIGVKFTGWQYPVVFGEDAVHFDNYEGAWGDRKQLDRFTQEYAAQGALRHVRSNPAYAQAEIMRSTLKDGSIELTVSLASSSVDAGTDPFQG